MRRQTPGSRNAGRSLFISEERLMEVIIHYEKMTGDEITTVSETLAAIIVNHIQAKKINSKKENRMKDTDHDQKESDDGIMQPV